MGRLIDADELKLDLKWLEIDKPVYHDVMSTIDKIATVDAVEVVRCKDCIHKPTGSGVNHHITFPEQDYRCPCRCEDYWYSWMPDDDWFCANGERKEDND